MRGDGRLDTIPAVVVIALFLVFASYMGCTAYKGVGKSALGGNARAACFNSVMSTITSGGGSVGLRDASLSREAQQQVSEDLAEIVVMLCSVESSQINRMIDMQLDCIEEAGCQEGCQNFWLFDLSDDG